MVEGELLLLPLLSGVFRQAPFLRNASIPLFPDSSNEKMFFFSGCKVVVLVVWSQHIILLEDAALHWLTSTAARAAQGSHPLGREPYISHPSVAIPACGSLGYFINSAHRVCSQHSLGAEDDDTCEV